MSEVVANSTSNGVPIASSVDIAGNIATIKSKICDAALAAGRDPSAVDLVAVSKFKPVADIQACYDTGHRLFGENYFQELLEKTAELPCDVRWHFIGHLQSSKANKLIREVPNLAAVETVDGMKLAEKLNSACELAGREDPLNVYIQVKTSDEDSKSGVSATSFDVEIPQPDAAGNVSDASPDKRTELEVLFDYITISCPRLRLEGLMTIGAPGDMTCFTKLCNARDHLVGRAATISIIPIELKLSMGMSGDFETAIAGGSDIVRVGSSIFGSR